MKLICIKAKGLPLFKEPLEINFFAQQRVYETDKLTLYPLFPGIYLNNANAFIGINASGKTSVLNVILLVLGLLNNEPINHLISRMILSETKKAEFDVIFYAAPNKICRLCTTIAYLEGMRHYIILNETLWEKTADKNIKKKSLTDFSDLDPIAFRNNKEGFLPDDISFIIARNKREKETIQYIDLGYITNLNILTVNKETNIPVEIISFLDPTVESLWFEIENNQPIIHLKFFNKKEILLNSALRLENYLSSGTIKGIMTFITAEKMLKTGGYLVIDEIENHFNREIVATLMRLFMDARLNKKGATLIFTTHYPELLDEYDRNDCIHIIRNRNGITVDNLRQLLKRNDIKKSDAYQSGFLEGTTPTYDAYIRLKKRFAKAIEQ